MSYYRDVYLKSPEWESLRLKVLQESEYFCEVCRIQSYKMDVHHLNYGNLHDVIPKDLMSVCRGCHDKIHKLMKKHPKLKKLGSFLQRRIILSRIGVRPSSLKEEKFSKRKIFTRMRDMLCYIRVVKRHKMKLHPAVLSHSFIPARKKPFIYLQQYIKATGIDPRHRVDRIGPHKLLLYKNPSYFALPMQQSCYDAGMKDELQLKPCPFCGGDAKLVWDMGWKVYCGTCINAYFHSYFQCKHDAATRWNARANCDKD